MESTKGKILYLPTSESSSAQSTRYTPDESHQEPTLSSLTSAILVTVKDTNGCYHSIPVSLNLEFLRRLTIDRGCVTLEIDLSDPSQSRILFEKGTW